MFIFSASCTCSEDENLPRYVFVSIELTNIYASLSNISFVGLLPDSALNEFVCVSQRLKPKSNVSRRLRQQQQQHNVVGERLLVLAENSGSWVEDCSKECIERRLCHLYW